MFLEDGQSRLAPGEDGFSEFYDLPVPRGQRPLGGEPVPDASQELVALLDGPGVLDRGAGVGRPQRGEQAVKELPAVRGRAFHDPYVVGEERYDAGPRAAGGVVGEGRGGDPVDRDALLLSRGRARRWALNRSPTARPPPRPRRQPPVCGRGASRPPRSR